MTKHRKWYSHKSYIIIFILTIMVITPVICLWANILSPENIKLSNFRSAPTIPFQVLPNTQKFKVYDSTACEGCDNVSTLFSASEFKQGQADQLIKAIERTTGLNVPDGIDATTRLNSLMTDPDFWKKLLEMGKKNEISSLEFSVGEFKQPVTPEALIKAIQTSSGINVPMIETPIQSLNKLLEDKNLYRVMTRRSDEVKDFMGRLQQGQWLTPLETKEFNSSLTKASSIKEFTNRLQQGQQLSLLETKALNRFLIEANYPQETPKMQDTLTVIKSIRTLSFSNYLSPDEIRSILEANYPQETPKTFTENYQKVQNQLPICVQNEVYVTNKHLFPKDGTHIHFAFSTDNKMYYGVPVLLGFDLMELDADTHKASKIAHFYVGDYIVPNLRISTISVSPDNKKIAIDITSDSITLFGDSYHDMVVLNLGGQKIKVYDLGNKASYGGWWSPASDMFYTSCPISEHSSPQNNKVCGINLNSD
jgi:hypothetical protein